MYKQDFEQLTLPEKIIVVVRNAVPLIFIKKENTFFNLYYLKDHFIEVRMNDQSKDVECVSIIQYIELDKYVDQIQYCG